MTSRLTGILQKIQGRFGRILFGVDSNSLASKHERLKARMATIDAILAAMAEEATSPDVLWLWKNRGERMDATRDFFDAGRRRFHLARYEFAANYVAGKDAADIACGTGYGSELLALRGARSVVGVDIDEGAVCYARTHHAPSNADFRCAQVSRPDSRRNPSTSWCRSRRLSTYGTTSCC